MNILLACDTVLSNPSLQRGLEGPGIKILPAKDGKTAKMIFASHGPRVVVVDWRLPDMTASDLYKQLSDVASVPGTQWIVVVDDEMVPEAMQSEWACELDLLIKPLTPNRLASKLRSCQRTVDLCIDLQTAQQRIRELEGRDELTGALSRSTLIDRMKLELERSWRDQRFLGVILADIDAFKSLNATHGHEAGDALLRALCGHMIKTVRPYDLVARYSGGAFLFVLPGCGSEAAGVLAERIRAGVASTQWNCQGHSVACTMSLGVTSVTRMNSSRLEEVLGLADTALLKAKRAGGNRVASAPMPDHMASTNFSAS